MNSNVSMGSALPMADWTKQSDILFTPQCAHATDHGTSDNVSPRHRTCVLDTRISNRNHAYGGGVGGYSWLNIEPVSIPSIKVVLEFVMPREISILGPVVFLISCITTSEFVSLAQSTSPSWLRPFQSSSRVQFQYQITFNVLACLFDWAIWLIH